MSESNRLLNFATSSELIANGEGRNVLSAIEDGLRNGDEFLISVAFITPEGLLTLKPILKELEDRGVHGRILTTDYLGFNSPQVLEDLGNLNNIELKLNRESESFINKLIIDLKENISLIEKQIDNKAINLERYSLLENKIQSYINDMDKLEIQDV